MNPRDFLKSHPLVLRAVEYMLEQNLSPEAVGDIVNLALRDTVPDMVERGEIVRVVRRMAKKESGGNVLFRG